MGSPRKNGDTKKIIQIIENNMTSFSDTKFEYIYLSDANIELCKGCQNCFLKGEDKCPHKDDIPIIKQKMLDADGIIFATPVYAEQVTAYMKMLIDRLSYLYHRPEMFHQKALMVTSSAGGDVFKGMFKYMKGVSEAWGMKYVDVLGIPILDSLQPKFKQKQIDKIAKVSEKFYNELLDKDLPKPKLSQLIWFKVWRVSIGNSGWLSIDPGSSAYDYNHWKKKGWLDKNTYYYYDTKVNFLKKFFANIIEKIINHFMKKAYKFD